MRRLTIALLALSAVALLGGAYLFTFCVPLESACHLHDDNACARLVQTMSQARALAVIAAALLVAAVAQSLVRRIRRGRPTRASRG